MRTEAVKTEAIKAGVMKTEAMRTEAMRIMEALSGVDEELLARCEAAGAGTEALAAGAETAGSGAEAQAAGTETAGLGTETADTGAEASALRAERKGRAARRKGWNGYRRYLGRCAAVFALAVVGAVGWMGVQMSRKAMLDGASGGNASTSGGNTEAAQDMALNRNLEDGAGGDGGSAGTDGWDTFLLYGEYGGQDPESVAAEMNTQGIDKEMSYMLGSAGGEGGQDGNVAGGVSGSDGVGGNAAGSQDEKDALDVPEGSGSDNKDALDKIDKEDLTGAGGTDKKNMEVTSCPALTAQVLTEEEARGLELLGAYVPSALPAGYGFETAWYYAETGRLTVCWHRGMDSIILSLEQTDGAGAATADAGKPETYDERLYEIPFGDTVPEEYRETFFAPVFAKDDFSLEIVRSRVISYSGDSGDTSTPRGNFSVLYDGVLVGFNGRGTPEEIWEMFASVAE